MSDRAKYSRTYWGVMDDPQFDGIRENVRHFGAWSLMLIAADMAWPTLAYVPPVVPPASLSALVDAGLVVQLTGGRFRLRGMDKERERRKAAATRDPAAPQLGPNWEADGRVDKTRQDKQSKDETSKGDRDSLDTYYELTLYRPWGVFSGDKLKVAMNDYGDATVEAALRAEYGVEIDRKTLLDRTLARLARDADRKRTERKTTPRQVRVVTSAERAAALQELREETA